MFLYDQMKPNQAGVEYLNYMDYGPFESLFELLPKSWYSTSLHLKTEHKQFFAPILMTATAILDKGEIETEHKNKIFL